MSRITSDVDICNEAVARIGGKLIQSLDDPTTHTETLLQKMYPKNRRIVLRSAVWNFATKITTLVKTSETLDGYLGVFALPEDFIRFLGVPSLEYTASDVGKYRLSDRKIYLKYSSADSVTLDYIFDNTNILKWDDLFIEALSLRLAYNLSFALSGKNTLADRLMQEYLEVLREAKAIDGQEQKPTRRQQSVWLTKRRQGTSSRYASSDRYFYD